jgi:DNA-binding beta-propeller fold protein YncE
MAVDRLDHLYVVQRPGSLASNERFTGSDDTPPKADCCIPAPPVLEFDQPGTLIHSWGGPGQGYDWPQTEHGVFVDAKDNVWLAGSGEKDAHLLKFTREGKFLQQFGKPGTNGGSADTRNLGQPANLTIDQVSNEIYVADGYRNRRVIVIDADTFAFKRMWGAYGNKPDDTPLGPYNPDAPPAQQFRLPHNIAISRDGFVYVADRPNNRIQVFRKDGTYVKEVFVSKRTLLQGAASGFALSTDPQQRWLYMIDGANHHVWILDRQSLRIVARFGQQGLWGGALNVPHAIAVDGRGNVYVGENFDARRFQRFLYKGIGTPKVGTIPPTTIVQ